MTKVDKTPGSALNRWAGYLMVFIALAHTAFFVPAAEWSQWLTGGLWNGAASDASYATFWALPGGFVPALLVLGLLVVRQARRGEYLPAYVGWVLLAWCVGCTALIGPSGFISGIAPAVLLIGGNLTARRAATSHSHRAGVAAG